jgi:serine protease Do
MRSIRLRRCSRLLVAALVVCFTATMPARGSSRRNSAIVQVVRQTNPSVVDIRSEKTVLYESATNLRPFEHGRRINGMGTGVIIDERGYIVTNYHVIEGVQMINVTLSNGEKHPNARVIARDRDNDLAIIKINSRHPLPVLPMGTSNDLMLGETVIAVGNAFGTWK